MRTTAARAGTRVALVTGGAGVIGEAISTALAGAGHAIAVGYHSDHARATICAKHLAEAHRVATCAVRVSLDDPSSLTGAVASVRGELGPVDVLVNNAVAWPSDVERAQAFRTAPPADWIPVLRANLEGTLALTGLALAGMVEQGWGRVITISTNLVEGGMPSDVAYIAAKGGLTAASRALAWEAGPHGVTVNLVAPGLTAEKGASLPATVTESIVEQTPRCRLTSAAEIAAAVAYLASDGAAAVTGQVLTVSGGH